MKANELMIGDWVLFNGNPKKVTSLLVTDLGVDQIYVFGKSCQVATISEYIEPIPLTAEILEKNAEKEKDVVGDTIYRFMNSEYCVRVMGKRYSFIRNCSASWWICDINNVHELQHALKLCGINKSIEL